MGLGCKAGKDAAALKPRAFSGEVCSRFAVENATNQESRAVFRFNLIENRSRSGRGAREIASSDWEVIEQRKLVQGSGDLKGRLQCRLILAELGQRLGHIHVFEI